MRLTAAAILVLGGIFATGCGTDCDEAADRIQAKYDECGIETTDGGDEEDVECTDELGAQSLCIAACIEAQDCSILDGTSTDTDALTAYGECVGGC